MITRPPTAANAGWTAIRSQPQLASIIAVAADALRYYPRLNADRLNASERDGCR